MKRSLASVFLTAVFVLSCFLIGTTSYAQEKVINLKLATFFPKTFPGHEKFIEEWIELIGKRTNGKVKITLYPASTLLSSTQMYDGVTKRVADIGLAYFDVTKGRFPMMEALSLPLGAKTAYATKLAIAYYKHFRPKELDDVKVLMLSGTPPGTLLTLKPVRTLEDLKGLKIRGQSISTQVAGALGAAPVGIPMTDVYDALSKGVINGVMNERASAYHYKLTDLVKYAVENEATGYRSTFYYVMNKNVWNSLPKDIQAVFDKVSEEWQPARNTAMWLEWESIGRTGCQKAGVQDVKLSPEEELRWKARVQPIIDEWINTTKAKGLPAKEAIKFIRDWLKANQK